MQKLVPSWAQFLFIIPDYAWAFNFELIAFKHQAKIEISYYEIFMAYPDISTIKFHILERNVHTGVHL